MAKQIQDMSKHILFNLASKTRPHKFNRLVAQLHDMCSQPFTILAKLDTDDKWLHQYDRTGVTLALGKSNNKVHAVNRDITGEWDILINVSDDLVFTRPGFDNLIREHCGPDDFLLFPEPFVDKQIGKNRQENIAVMSVIGRQYYERDNYVYHPSYISLWADNEATAVARERGRCKEMTEYIFYHAHPVAGYGKKDAQYKHTESFFKRDKENYLQRKEAGFP